jgi:hypothetical protein
MNQGTIRPGMTNPIPDGLSLEYKRNYGTARRNLHLADLVNNPAAQGEIRIFSLGLPEQFFDRCGVEIRPLFEDLTNPVVIGADSVELLK